MRFFIKFYSYPVHCPSSCWCSTTSAAKNERSEAALFDLQNSVGILSFLVIRGTYRRLLVVFVKFLRAGRRL